MSVQSAQCEPAGAVQTGCRTAPGAVEEQGRTYRFSLKHAVRLTRAKFSTALAKPGSKLHCCVFGSPRVHAAELLLLETQYDGSSHINVLSCNRQQVLSQNSNTSYNPTAFY